MFCTGQSIILGRGQLLHVFCIWLMAIQSSLDGWFLEDISVSWLAWSQQGALYKDNCPGPQDQLGFYPETVQQKKSQLIDQNCPNFLS